MLTAWLNYILTWNYKKSTLNDFKNFTNKSKSPSFMIAIKWKLMIENSHLKLLLIRIVLFIGSSINGFMYLSKFMRSDLFKFGGEQS